MEDFSYEDVTKLDNALFQLASYDVTHGMIIVAKSQKEADTHHIKAIQRYNYFKRLIQRGSCTFDFIKNDVLSRNGAFKQKPFDLDDLLKPRHEQYENIEAKIDLMDSLLRNVIFPKSAKSLKKTKNKKKEK